MHTYADGNIIFRSSKGRLYYSLQAAILLICAVSFAAVAHGMIEGTNVSLFLVIGLIFLPLSVLIIIFARLKIVLEKEGIRLPNVPMCAQKFIPYVNVTRFYERSDLTGLTIGVSLDQVWIDYINVNGKKDGIGLSPENKDLFIAELTKRTGIPISANPNMRSR
ncbi:MAG: PH domain-containing protein [Methanomassiliicoccaceae archaeon]|nr:PH domain-containing protein [Methanomassiliicoccaceae archaeon]